MIVQNKSYLCTYMRRQTLKSKTQFSTTGKFFSILWVNDYIVRVYATIYATNVLPLTYIYYINKKYILKSHVLMFDTRKIISEETGNLQTTI